MKPEQILDMIATNRHYIRLKSNIALQNLAMLHKSFDNIADEECILGLALNDSVAALTFSADYARSIDISQGVLDRFPHSSHAFLVASHLALIGRCHTFLIMYDTARLFLQKAEQKAFDITALTDDVVILRADILHDLAMNSHHAGADTEVSMAYLQRALGIMEQTGIIARRGICLMGMGNLMSGDLRYDSALNYHKQAVVLFEESESYPNLSAALCNMGMCYMHLDQMQNAEKYLLRALDIRQRLGSYWEIANSYYNLGLFYKHKGDPSRAYESMLTARDYAMISQAKGMQLAILEDLEAIALVRSDAEAAERHRVQRAEIAEA